MIIPPITIGAELSSSPNVQMILELIRRTRKLKERVAFEFIFPSIRILSERTMSLEYWISRNFGKRIGIKIIALINTIVTK